jgi:hypothetical protein
VPRREYHDIIKDFEPCFGEDCRLEDEEGPVGWTEARFGHVMRMRQASVVDPQGFETFCKIRN